MVIDKVIFTIDDNPHYMGFWKSISKHYVSKLKIKPKLFVIGDSNTDITLYQNDWSEVEFVQKLENVPTIIQALIGKFYFTIGEPDSVWLIGDLDLYPLQSYHFIERIRDIGSDKYLHLNPHAYGINWRDSINGLAGYYHVAKGKTFSEELKFENKSFLDVCNEILFSNKYGIKFHNNNASNESKQASKDWGWFCCEEMYTGFILRQSDKLLEMPPNGGIHSRIDRSDMKYDLDLLKNGYYIDFHSPRPYEAHSDTIEYIISNANIC
jgi:hypothetical protein